ncbi:MAG TPA: hypothetical protein PK712_05785, partial [Rectinema sp.]|nr:hypothetical protein [Rectinema sp.]
PTGRKAEDKAPTASVPTSLWHGGLPADFDISSLDVMRVAQKQNKKGKNYAGFYLYEESQKAGAEEYARQSGASLHRFDVKPDAKVLELGNIERIKVEQLQEYASQGYDLLKGKDVRGRVEYILLNKDAITNVAIEKKIETPTSPKKTFLGIDVDVFRKSMAETEEETVEEFRESLSEADYNDYRDLCNDLLGSDLSDKELNNAIEWLEVAYNSVSDILNISEEMSLGQRPAYMRDRSEIRSSIKALKEAVAKKTNAKLDDSPLSYDVYSNELAEELIDYLFKTDPKDGLYPWKRIQKKIEEEPFTDEALSKKSKDELDANLRYVDAIDRFAASIGVEEESYLSDDSRMFNEEYTLEEYESEKEAALTAINDARNRIMRHIAAAKDNKEPAKLTLPTQEEIDEKLGEVFDIDKHGLYYWYEMVDWVEEMAQAEDAATMQINLVYLEAALDYAKETPRSKARVGEKGFTEDFTPTDYNKERSEALDALRNAVNSLKKKVKELPPEEILAKPEAAPAPTSKKGKKKKEDPTEEPTEEPTEPPVGDTEDDVDTDDVDEEGDADLDDAINALLSELGGDGKGKGKGKASSSKLRDKASKAKRS